MGETTKQIIISKVKLVKGGIRINYEKYRDSYWDNLQLTSEEKAAPEFYDAFQSGAEHPKFMATQTWKAVQHLLDETEKYIKGRRAQGNLFESDTE